MPDATEGLISILSKLDEDGLFALARTVTQGLKKSGTVNDAVQNIIKYSPNYLSILRRKAVTREILFEYLEDINVKVKLPVTKNELIDAITNAWNIPGISSQIQENTVLESCISEGTTKEPKQESNVNSMAEEFAKWFYSMLNNNECGAEHFFQDAKLKIKMYVDDDCETTVIDNDPEEMRSALLRIRLEHHLHFNPNDSRDGIQGRMDHHGLVLVLTCGTLHMQNICAGVFEQVFALARDPFSDNNWKIKNSELNLRSKSNVFESPKLCDSELTSELLMLPSE